MQILIIDDTKYEEKEVLYRYLGAKYYEHPYYYGWQSVEACHNQYIELASSVLDNYTGYYAEEIQSYRDKILKRYQRLEDFKRYTIIPSCKADACKYSGAIEVCPDGSITAYNYCWSHKCKSLGCRNDKDTLDYCTEHCPWNDICSYNKCDKLVYYEGGKSCREHRCQYAGCLNCFEKSYNNKWYCQNHYEIAKEKRKKEVAELKKEKEKQKEEEKKKPFDKYSQKWYTPDYDFGKLDTFDVYDFDDPDDFADEWAEDFGDGNFDEGWEDAWDYWQDHHENE